MTCSSWFEVIIFVPTYRDCQPCTINPRSFVYQVFWRECAAGLMKGLWKLKPFELRRHVLELCTLACCISPGCLVAVIACAANLHHYWPSLISSFSFSKWITVCCCNCTSQTEDWFCRPPWRRRSTRGEGRSLMVLQWYRKEMQQTFFLGLSECMEESHLKAEERTVCNVLST